MVLQPPYGKITSIRAKDERSYEKKYLKKLHGVESICYIGLNSFDLKESIYRWKMILPLYEF